MTLLDLDRLFRLIGFETTGSGPKGGTCDSSKSTSSPLGQCLNAIIRKRVGKTFGGQEHESKRSF
jgi:hypothetical protein